MQIVIIHLKYLILGIQVSFLSLCLFSCNEDTAGGGCTYDTSIYPARLISMEKLNSQYFDLAFEVTRLGEKDTLLYSGKNNGHYLTDADITKDSLVPGNQYQYMVKKIISGSCNPKIEIILLKPFPGNQ